MGINLNNLNYIKKSPLEGSQTASKPVMSWSD
jgi:hypothetical protein